MALDWSCVGWDSHPIPGRPDEVSEAARSFRRTKDFLDQALVALRRFDDGYVRSDAVEVLRSDAREISGMLRQALDRYDVAAQALATYAPALSDAKARAEQAVQGAAAADREHRAAVDNYNDLRLGALTSLDPDQRAEFLRAMHQAKSQADAASSTLNAARARVQDAVNDNDAAANQAAARIQTAISDRELNDNLIDQVTEKWNELVAGATVLAEELVKATITVFTWIWENMETISDVLLVLSLTLGWVPVVGQVLILAALVAKVLVLIKDTIKTTIAFGKGLATGDFTEFFDEAAGLLVSLVMGKVGSKLAKAATSSVMGSTAKAAFDRSVRQNGFVKSVAAVGRAKHPAPQPVRDFLLGRPDTGKLAQADELIAGLMSGPRFVLHTTTGHVLGAGVELAVDEVENSVAPFLGEALHDAPAQLGEGVDRAADALDRVLQQVVPGGPAHQQGAR